MSNGTGSMKFRGVDLELEYEAEDFIPAVWTLSNGDPGYPSEGGDFYITAVYVKGIDILELIQDSTLDQITEEYLRKNQ